MKITRQELKEKIQEEVYHYDEGFTYTAEEVADEIMKLLDKYVNEVADST